MYTVERGGPQRPDEVHLHNQRGQHQDPPEEDRGNYGRLRSAEDGRLQQDKVKNRTLRVMYGR